jgi:cytoskeletal protein CcmA (bactofilin family)
VRGEANGSIYAEKLILRTACAVEGEVYHHYLVLEDGCLFEGKSRRHANLVELAPESSCGPPELATDPLGSLPRGS